VRRLALQAQLQERPALRQLLTSALAQGQPDAASLAREHPRWEVDDLIRRLRAAGELGTDGWLDEVRTAYLAALEQSPTTNSPLGRCLTSLQAHDRPREKALNRGIDTLGDNELLALLLRTGGSDGVLALADRLLQDHDGLLGLAGCDIIDLMANEGIGQAKAAELAAAFELGRRLVRASRGDRPSMRTATEVAAYMGPLLAAKLVEEVWCLPLDVRCRLLGQPLQVSSGDVDGSEASPRLVFRQSIRAGASSCILVHNHPTGDPAPSRPDITLTKRLIRAGAIVGIPLVDHLIIGDGERWTSLRQFRPELFTDAAW
jgi:DNA repair protein RadC